MADHRLNELTTLINYHVESLEKQTHHFGMMSSLVEVATTSAFFEQERLTSHYYLQAIGELLEKAAGINEASIALLRYGLTPSVRGC